MSEKPDFPLSVTSRNLGVVPLSGVSHLTEAEQSALADQVCINLRQLYDVGKPFVSTVIQCGTYAGVVVDNQDGTHTMFIGLGLEVIQALQQSEKK